MTAGICEGKRVAGVHHGGARCVSSLAPPLDDCDLLYAEEEEFLEQTLLRFYQSRPIEDFISWLVKCNQTEFRNGSLLQLSYRDYCINERVIAISQRALQRAWRKIGGKVTRPTVLVIENADGSKRQKRPSHYIIPDQAVVSFIAA